MKPHRCLQISALTFALVLGNNAPAFCRSPQNIPSQVQKLGIAEDVTVILLTGKEYYGAIRKVEPDSFEIAEVDLKQVMAFDYKDVKKVRKGYGGRGFAGKRVNPRNQWIAGAAVLGLLIVLPVIMLASSKD